MCQREKYLSEQAQKVKIFVNIMALFVKTDNKKI